MPPESCHLPWRLLLLYCIPELLTIALVTISVACKQWHAARQPAQQCSSTYGSNVHVIPLLSC